MQEVASGVWKKGERPRRPRTHERTIPTSVNLRRPRKKPETRPASEEAAVREDRIDPAINNLSDEELAEALGYEMARRNFGYYCRWMKALPDYSQPPHVRLLIEHLQKLERREIRKLIVEMPPRSSKSLHVSRLFPSWYLGRNTNHKVIITSYGDHLATDHGRAVRDLLTHPRYPFVGTLRSDSKAAGRWQTEEGGQLIAAGRGSGLTGQGGHLIIADDMVKDRAEADSLVVRENSWSWFQEVLLTRLQKDGVICVTMTRWSEDDIIGRILNSPGAEEWTRLRLPYLAEVEDVLGRTEGEPLQIFGEPPSLEDGEITPRGWAALYQQRPAPEEGGMFKREWMKRRWTVTGNGPIPDLSYTRLPTDHPKWRYVQSIDASLRDGIGKDYSVIATWATDGISYYLIDRWKRRCEYPDLRDAAEQLYWRYRPREVVVEDAANGRPLISDLRARTPIPVIGIRAIGSKTARAESVTPLFASGHVVLPGDAAWLDDWIEEHVTFPNAMHDDQVDSTSLALHRLGNFTSKQWGTKLFGELRF